MIRDYFIYMLVVFTASWIVIWLSYLELLVCNCI